MTVQFEERVQQYAAQSVPASRSRYWLYVFLIWASLGLCAGICDAANIVYLSQTAGAFSGGSICNGQSTQAYTYFDNSKNWTSGAPTGNQIGPGTTVILCGTIGAAAGSSPLTFQGSGTSGASITLLFDTGASLQEAYFGSTGAINFNGHNYITVNGQNTGTVEATLNGTSGGTCPGGTCSSQQNSNGIEGAASNDTIENLRVGPMYTRSGTTDEAPASLSVDCVDIGNSSSSYSNVTVTGNTLHDCMNGVFYEWGTSGGSNLIISENTIYNVNWAMGEAGCTNSTTFTGMYLFQNHTYNLAAWDDTVHNDFHHNAFHAFQCAGSTATVADLYIYNNEFDGPVGDCCVTSQVYIDNNGGNTYFANGAIFNNVFSWANGDCTQTCGNGLMGVFSGTGWLIANNTYIGNATSNSKPQGTELDLGASGVSATLLNNLMTTGVGEIGLANSPTLQNASPNYQIYANSPSSTQVFQHQTNFYSANQFSAWQGAVGADSNSAYVATDPLPLCTSNTDCSQVQPAAGSAAIKAAENLYSTCNGQPNPGLGALCYDKAGNPRPIAGKGNWDAGAYQYSALGLKSPNGLAGPVVPQ